ncbi:MAG: type 4a pilus biogenesis protein PilO [bacterium]
MEKREKYMLIGVGVLAVGLGLWYGYTYFWENYNNWHKKIQENVKRLREAQNTARRIDQLVKDVKKTSKKLKIALRKLPEQQEFFQLMSKLETEATNANISPDSILKFQRASERPRNLVVEMPIQAEFEQIAMGNLVMMLWKYKNMERLIDISKFELKPVETAQGEQRYNVTLRLRVYTIKESKSKNSNNSQETS